MRRILALALGLALLVGTGWAADLVAYLKVSATQTVTNSTLASGTQTVVLVNDGANEVYFELFGDQQTPADATTSSKELKANESLSFHFEGQQFGTLGNKYFKTLSIICAAGETATVRVYSQ